MNKIPENVMTVIKTITPLLVVIVLFIIVGQFGIGKIKEIRQEVDAASKDQNILVQKIDILRSIETNGQKYSNIAVSALPEDNSSLSLISQIKVVSGKVGVSVSEIKASTPGVDKSGLSFVNVSFRVIGQRSQIEAFIKSIQEVSPITIVDKVKISESAPGTSLANITVKSFWAPFPTKIPAANAAISDLTTIEKQTLESLNSLAQPIFTEIPPTTGGRSDPFVQ